MESSGVNLHWLTSHSNDWSGLEADNTLAEPLNRRGPRNLPLKSGDWNTVTMKLTDKKVTIALNGEEVYDRPLEDLSGRHFGLYHDRNKSAAQVRNVTLSGDWPETLSAEQLGNLVAFDTE